MFYIVHALDNPGSAARRKIAYDSHIEHLNEAQRHAIRIVLAGPLLDNDEQTPVGSVFLLEAQDEVGVCKFISANSFMTEGVWSSLTINAFRRGRGLVI